MLLIVNLDQIKQLNNILLTYYWKTQLSDKYNQLLYYTKQKLVRVSVHIKRWDRVLCCFLTNRCLRKSRPRSVPYYKRILVRITNWDIVSCAISMQTNVYIKSCCITCQLTSDTVRVKMEQRDVTGIREHCCCKAGIYIHLPCYCKSDRVTTLGLSLSLIAFFSSRTVLMLPFDRMSVIRLKPMRKR